MPNYICVRVREYVLGMREWVRVPSTNNWTHDDDELGTHLRQVVVRQPRMNEPNGTMYEVTGEGHEYSKHDTLDEAMAAAEASLAG